MEEQFIDCKRIKFKKHLSKNFKHCSTNNVFKNILA